MKRALRRMLEEVALEAPVVERGVVEDAMRDFVLQAGAAEVEFRWVDDPDSGMALSRRPVWWPVVAHSWPWGGRSEFRLLQHPGQSDLPRAKSRKRVYVSVVDQGVKDELEGTRSATTSLVVSGMTLASQIAEWAAWSEAALADLEATPLTADLDAELHDLELWREQETPRARLAQRHLRYVSCLMNLELREPLVRACAGGLFAFFANGMNAVSMILVPRPRMVLEDGVPHCWDAPAVSWPGGESHWFWHGVRLSPAIAARNGRVTVQDILKTTDTRRRRVYIERFGRGQYKEALKSLPPDRRKPLGRDDVIYAALEVAADEIEKSSDTVGSHIAFGSSQPEIDAGAARLDLPPSEAEFEDDFIWDEWCDANPQVVRLVEVSKEPRGGMFTYSHTVVAVPLPSGRRVYLEWGDATDFGLVAVSAPTFGERADDRFLQEFVRSSGKLDLPVSFAGDELSQIDLLWSLAETSDLVLDALTDGEADWMSSRMIDEGIERRGVTAEKIKSLFDREVDHQETRALDDLMAAPPWFFLLGGEELAAVADLPVVDSDPPFIHVFEPWQRPGPSMFRDLSFRSNLQHVVAAFVIGREHGVIDI